MPRNAPSPYIDLTPWFKSFKQAVETGATFSQRLSITPEEWCNDIGQIYNGPVVIITDALCYSATDIFAAGFQDHKIGPILGTGGNTGGWRSKRVDSYLSRTMHAAGNG